MFRLVVRLFLKIHFSFLFCKQIRTLTNPTPHFGSSMPSDLGQWTFACCVVYSAAHLDNTWRPRRMVHRLSPLPCWPSSAQETNRLFRTPVNLARRPVQRRIPLRTAAFRPSGETAQNRARENRQEVHRQTQRCGRPNHQQHHRRSNLGRRFHHRQLGNSFRQTAMGQRALSQTRRLVTRQGCFLSQKGIRTDFRRLAGLYHPLSIPEFAQIRAGSVPNGLIRAVFAQKRRLKGKNGRK